MLNRVQAIERFQRTSHLLLPVRDVAFKPSTNRAIVVFV